MKKQNMGIWGKIAKLFNLVMVFAFVILLANPLTAEAKVKSKTLKSVKEFQASVSYAESVATTIKKGNYKFKLKKVKNFGRAYVKFTAPKSKTYSFTASNLHASNGKYANGYFHVYKQDPRYTDNFVDADKAKYFATRPQREFKKKNTTKAYLNEGETAYIYISADGIFAKYVTFNFTIK